ncbi:ATP-dependent helicase [Caryophanon tenue]|uniref:DNA 3'-5' helicase n=1 Tax=Caryophanon tenue TaxID=33978 RepID=A0A1C0YKZ0_9BACL|nr:ATP-dependent helicase [Caryophanon tenue]OCS87820.1 hypothetical protein A6M13_11010 [Caryophanon tenue]
MDITLAEVLESNNTKIPVDQNFKLYAGPGAGKTTFLVNHINEIVHNSTRLSKNRKIACITYTNTAVNTLKNKLAGCDESVEICTIHSFCYRYIVKPFIWVLSNCEIPIDKINGHEEIKLRQSQITEFKRITNQFQFDDKLLAKALSKLIWSIEDGKLILKFPKINDGKLDNYNIKKTSYLEYKKLYWSDGKLSHDDVLYFAYRILTEKTEVLRVIRAMFPYILIDEFQDTSPIQAEIIKIIGKIDTYVAVIGDLCQSIYSFQGANVSLFKEFNLNETKEYIISGNRRSTEQIINVLNKMRGNTDFQQFSPNGTQGEKPTILIGAAKDVEIYLNGLYSDVVYLSYKNTIETFDDIILKDSNSDRSWMIYYVAQSIEFAKNLDMSSAMKYMKQAYRKNSNFDDKFSLMNLKRLISKYPTFENTSITSFYNDFLVGHYDVKGKISRGAIKDFYDSMTFNQLVTQINNVDKNSINYKTIHQSKGDEFETVCIIFSSESKEKNLEFLINPDMNQETHRVYYVALSRAMKRLFINVDNLETDLENKMIQIGFEVIRL